MTAHRTFSTEGDIAGLIAIDGKDTIYRDSKTPRLALRVAPTGRKTFIYVYRPPGESAPTKRKLKPRWPALTLKDARKQATAHTAELDRGANPLTAPPADMTLSDLIVKFKAAKDPATELIRILDNQIEPKFGKQRAGTIKTFQITEWHRAFAKAVKVRNASGKITGEKQVASPHAADKALDLLKSLLNFGMAQELIPFGRNPCVTVERNYTQSETERHHDWTDEEIARLAVKLNELENKAQIGEAACLTGINIRNKAGQIVEHYPSMWTVLAFRFLILTGVRKMEGLALEWDWIDERNNVIKWPKPNDTNKRKPERPITGPLASLIARLRAMRVVGCPYMFVGADRRSHLQEIDHVWDRIRHELGFYRVVNGARMYARVHDLRHFYGDEAGDANLNTKQIQALMGHSTERMSARYSKLRRAKKAEIGEVVAGNIERKFKVVS